MNCRVGDEPLRFNVGDPVLAKVPPPPNYDEESGDPNAQQKPEESGDQEMEEEDAWVPAHILVQWFEGAPYLVLLDDGETLTCMAMDSDAFVKANPEGKRMEQEKITEALDNMPDDQCEDSECEEPHTK